jgi:UrcA family protein
MINRKLATTFGSAVVMAMSSFASAAAADQVGTAELRSVTVTAPQVVRREMSGRIPVEVIRKSAAVHHDDLDLSRTADLSQLQARVFGAANQVCMELQAQAPNGHPDADVCADRARDDAMAAVDEAARRAGTTAVAAK